MTEKTTTPAARQWTMLARWTLLGTLGSFAGAMGINALLFAGYDGPRLWTGVLSAALFALLISAPTFFVFGRMRQELARSRQTLNQTSSVDNLTRCLDGKVFSSLVDSFRDNAIARAGKRRGAFLVVDVDRFKSINERFGHAWGDEALRVIAQEIKESVRSGDLVGRIGGEEFGVFLPGANLENAEDVAERIRNLIAETLFEPGGKRCMLTVSVGAVVFEDQLEFDALFRAADQQLISAKKGGRNRVVMQEIPQDPPGAPRPQA